MESKFSSVLFSSRSRGFIVAAACVVHALCSLSSNESIVFCTVPPRNIIIAPLLTFPSFHLVFHAAGPPPPTGTPGPTSTRTFAATSRVPKNLPISGGSDLGLLSPKENDAASPSGGRSSSSSSGSRIPSPAWNLPRPTRTRPTKTGPSPGTYTTSSRKFPSRGPTSRRGSTAGRRSS